MAELGFNMVKFWVQWRWNHPAEEKFSFDDIDRLMDLAHQNKLRVMLNTVFDVAPAWIYRKYSDASMITLDGRTIGPQTQPHRQIGGLGLCFNHADAMEHMFRFLRETVARYKDHPALEIWNVGSEPELTSSMSEMRLYADNSAKMGDMLCYCANCGRAFRKWLGEKYGTIEALNLSWNRNYGSFDEVELPKTRNTFNDMIDWRMFFVHTLGENVRRRFEVAKAEDGGKHPLMCHHVFIQGFPVTSTASDPWNVGRFGDLHGFTQMDDPMMSDILRSCAKGKPIISAEMLMLYGYTLDLPKPISTNDIKRFIFTGVAANQKGFIFWQYRPELLGREAPAWGLTFLDGSPTPWLDSYAEVGNVLQKNASFLLDATPRPAEVALLYNPENHIFAWEATGNEKSATDSLLGVHKALYERNITVDFLHPIEFDSDILLRYKVIIIPFPYCLNEQVCVALKDWVSNGGILIAESYFGGWDRERGRHAVVVPGYGFDEVFRARQGVVAPNQSDTGVEIILKKSLPFVSKGMKARGTLVRESLIPMGAEVIATFNDGTPAVTSARYGKGKAILIGTYLGLAYYRGKSDPNGAVIAGLVESAAMLVHPRVVEKAKVRVDVLTREQDAMLIMRNLERKSVQVAIEIPELKTLRMSEQFSGEKLKLTKQGNIARARVRLRAEEVKVYRA
jgi:beta-galactosidase